MSNQSAFSFVEVLVAMLILSMVLIALMDQQTRSLDLVSRTRFHDQATTLALMKMTELVNLAQEKGIHNLKDDEAGEFDQTKYPGYRWHYQKVGVPAPNFAALMSAVVAGNEEEPTSGTTNEALFAGPLQIIQKVWGNALKEVHLEVQWGDESSPRSYELVTHLIAPDAMGQLQAVMGAFGGSQPEGKAP